MNAVRKGSTSVSIRDCLLRLFVKRSRLMSYVIFPDNSSRYDFTSPSIFIDAYFSHASIICCKPVQVTEDQENYKHLFIQAYYTELDADGIIPYAMIFIRLLIIATCHSRPFEQARDVGNSQYVSHRCCCCPSFDKPIQKRSVIA